MPDCWVIVADGVRARILMLERNAGGRRLGCRHCAGRQTAHARAEVQAEIDAVLKYTDAA